MKVSKNKDLRGTMQNKHEVVDSDLKSIKEVEDVIARAIKKVNGRKENDLCRYLPMAICTILLCVK
jgi:hypothetical protein